jgi:hypothetical protein
MAGSLDYAGYTDDGGNTFVLKRDRTNSTATVAGAALMIPRTAAGTSRAPMGIKFRYALAYNEANPLQRRKFIIGNPSAARLILQGGAQISAEDYPGAADAAGAAQTWTVTYYSGEKSRTIPFPTGIDTVLTN